MRSAILGFVVGAAWLQMQPDLPGMWTLLALFAAVSSLALLFRKLHRRSARPAWRMAVLAIGGALAGFAWAALLAHYHLREELPEAWEGEDITLIGTIDSLPHRFDRGIRFNFAVEQVLPAGAIAGENAAASQAPPQVPSRLALSWYGGFRGEDTQTVPGILPGERWQLTVRLRRPHGNANPHVRVS